jgi:pimeloyl-ACP methyl ester carboxylesterase
MRLLESLEVLSVALATLSLGYAPAWTPLAVGLALLACLAQRRYEGARWQSWPLRAAVGAVVVGNVLLFAATYSGTAPAAGTARSLLHRVPQLLTGTAVVLAGLLTAASCGLLVLIPVFSLPTPGGVFPVSIFDIELQDDQRPEWIEPWDHDKAQPRRLVVRFVYPVAPTLVDSKAVKRAPYFGHMHKRTAAISRVKNCPRFVMEHLEHVTSNALVHKDGTTVLPPMALPGGLPVVVFSHGYCGTFDSHTAFLEDLASHGYFAASISHTMDALTTVFASTGEVVTFNATAPMDMLHSVEDLRTLRQRQLQVRVDDVAFVIRQLRLLNGGRLKGSPTVGANSGVLAGRLDMDRLSAAGHSFGGATALQAMSEIPAIKAAVVFDAWLFALPESIKQSALQKPVLFLQADHFFIENMPYGKGNTAQVANIVSATNQQKEGIAALGAITGAAHADFTDLAMFAPAITTLAKVTKLPGPWVHKVMVTVSLGFLRCATTSDDDDSVRRVLRSLSQRVAAEYPSLVTLTMQPQRATSPAA